MVATETRALYSGFTVRLAIIIILNYGSRMFKRLCTISTILVVAAVAPLAGQGVGLLIVAHGADTTWNGLVAKVADQVSWEGPVELAFLMGDASPRGQGWNDALGRIEASGVSRVVVVPLMVSSHGAHTRQIAHYAGQRDELPPELASHVHGPVIRPRISAVVTPALDAASELGAILLDRWRSLEPSDRDRPVVLVAHGPTSDADAERWRAALLAANAPLARELRGKPLRIGLIRDDAPPPERARAVVEIRDTIAALADASGSDVLVMTVLVSSSGLNTARVPADLAGTPMRYAGVVLSPHPALARWIERVAHDAM